MRGYVLEVRTSADGSNPSGKVIPILRLGAREEGTLRKHILTWNGRQRDSVYFSILDTEWPEVKARLESKLANHE